MKVLFTNNYPMDQIWKEWQTKEFPAHHLWGITHLSSHNIESEILPYQKWRLLNSIGWRLGLKEHLDQQLRILFKRSSDYDLVYSASHTNTWLLAFLRYLGLYKKPLVAIVHCPFSNTWRNKIFIKGHDKVICLSHKILQQFHQVFQSQAVDLQLQQKLEVLEWSIDLDYYDQCLATQDAIPQAQSRFILSAGKTSRDYNTLIQAFAGQEYPLHVYTLEELASIAADNITVKYTLSYRSFLEEYRQAYAIAIPLKMPKQESDVIQQEVTLIGLTSLLEAMAMSKPVIMTRNPQLDIDIEKEGIGLWVEPDDVQGWREATAYLWSHPAEAMEMGRRGRLLCEKHYGLEQFAFALARILKDSLYASTKEAKNAHA